MLCLLPLMEFSFLILDLGGIGRLFEILEDLDSFLVSQLKHFELD